MQFHLTLWTIFWLAKTSNKPISLTTKPPVPVLTLIYNL